MACILKDFLIIRRYLLKYSDLKCYTVCNLLSNGLAKTTHTHKTRDEMLTITKRMGMKSRP